MIKRFKTAIAVLLCLLTTQIAYAGIVNPDISVIGQVNSICTNDPQSEDKNKATMLLGETELVFDSNLNPYSRGTFIFTLDDGEFSIEEAYMTVFKGLPSGIGAKLGKYRLGFGKMNPAHPHTYQFSEAPRVISQFLPGDEGFNDVATQFSYLLPTEGSWASNLSADVLNGSSFHPDGTQTKMGWLGHWSNSFMIKDVTPVDIGISATQGVNNIAWNTKTKVYGFDLKTKIPVSVQGKLTLQGELFANNNDIVTDTATGTTANLQRIGFYTLADYQINTRTNFGAIYDQYQRQEDRDLVDKAIKCFVGYALLEETTLFRLTYEQFYPDGSPVVKTLGLQVLFSMGPHKAHQF